MSRSLFFLLAAIGAAGFGGLMFFAPASAAGLLGIESGTATFSVLRGMGGLIIGTATMNFLARTLRDSAALRAILITNIATHAFGLAADIWGIMDGALSVLKMAPVEATHLLVGIGSCIYLARLRNAPSGVAGPM